MKQSIRLMPEAEPMIILLDPKYKDFLTSYNKRKTSNKQETDKTWHTE